MTILAGPKDRTHVDYRLAVVALIVLLITLFYAVGFAFWVPDSGLTTNGQGTIITIPLCYRDQLLCETENMPIQVGDHLISVGPVAFQQYLDDRSVVLFKGYQTGDLVPLVVERDGIQFTVYWKIPDTPFWERLRVLLPTLVVALPFWLVGTATLIFMKPRDIRWLLLVLFSYLTLIWFSAGIISTTHYANSSLVMHSMSWVLVPVYWHFHLVNPLPIFFKLTHRFIPFLYALFLMLAGFELFQLLPSWSYYLAIFLAIFGSLGLLLYHLIKARSGAEWLLSRMMLAGIVLAFGPGVLFWLIPTFLNTGTPGILVTGTGMLALPLLPLFYGYAVYRRDLGIQESRANHLLSGYATFLLYVFVLSMAYIIGANLSTSTASLVIFLAIFSGFFVFTSMPLQAKITVFFNRLTYGINYEAEEVYHLYSAQIPAISGQAELVDFLTGTLAPKLSIRQSALIVFEKEHLTSLYAQELEPHQLPQTMQESENLLAAAGMFLPVPQGQTGSNTASWLRLITNLQVQGERIGMWLFGARDPDDFYSTKDIILLEKLGQLIAITLQTNLLWQEAQRELERRQLAESEIRRYAEHVRLIHEIDQAILAAVSPAIVATTVVDTLPLLIPCDHVSIIVFDKSAGTAEVLASSASTGQAALLETQYPAGFFKSILAARRGQVLNVPDLTELVNPSALQLELRNQGFHSLLLTPLHSSDEPIGSLNLASTIPDFFTQEQVEIVREVASSLVVALQNARLIAAIDEHRLELQALSARLFNAQEIERKRISYELHDEMGQMLTAITFNLSAMERAITHKVPEIIEEKLADTKGLVDELVTQVRSLSLELRPAMLQDLGLYPTLDWYIGQYTKRRGITLDFKADNIEERFPEEIETALYRIIQEALTNVTRHSQADHIQLNIERLESLMQVTIEDNGCGFETTHLANRSSRGQGLGLVAMRERVNSLGGTMNIRSAPRLGTRILIKIPLPEPIELELGESGKVFENP